ncbi:MAG: hypothetical protein V3V59_07850 [Thermodesulfovibrionales bacterium]
MIRVTFISAIIFISLVQGVYSANFDEIERNGATITYEEGLKNAALEILGTVPAIRNTIQSRVGLSLDFPFHIIIFKARENFIKQAGNDLVAAYAVPAKSLIVMDLSQMRVHPLNIELIIMHEITHLVLHHFIKKGNLPKWFDEGISEWVSGISDMINPGKKDVLKRAVISRKVIPLYRLSHSFPRDRNGFKLAYEQSRSMVEYIENEYGEDALRSIIMRLKNGGEFNEAVRNEFSITFAELERSWLKDIDVRYTWLGYISNNIYWILFVFGALIVVVGFIRLRWRIKNYKDDDEEDEIALLEKLYRNDGQDNENK